MPRKRKDFTLSENIIKELAKRKHVTSIPESRMVEKALEFYLGIKTKRRRK